MYIYIHVNFKTHIYIYRNHSHQNNSRSNAKEMQKYFASKLPGKGDGPSSIRANCLAMDLQASAWQHADVEAATFYNVVLSRTGCMKLQDTWGTSIMLLSNCHISGILQGVHEGEPDQVQGGDAPGKDCHDGLALASFLQRLFRQRPFRLRAT